MPLCVRIVVVYTTILTYNKGMVAYREWGVAELLTVLHSSCLYHQFPGEIPSQALKEIVNYTKENNLPPLYLIINEYDILCVLC